MDRHLSCAGPISTSPWALFAISASGRDSAGGLRGQTACRNGFGRACGFATAAPVPAEDLADGLTLCPDELRQLPRAGIRVGVVERQHRFG
jgi:hypothetical protein